MPNQAPNPNTLIGAAILTMPPPLPSIYLSTAKGRPAKRDGSPTRRAWLSLRRWAKKDEEAFFTSAACVGASSR
jgi:hypothetical protein